MLEASRRAFTLRSTGRREEAQRPFRNAEATTCESSRSGKRVLIDEG
jgi:hypothetical protein